MTNWYKLWHGDCLKELDRVTTGSIDLICADLPYGSTQCAWDTPIPLDQLWIHYKRIIKPNGAVILFGNQPYTSFEVQSSLEWFKYSIIWEKTQATGFFNAKKQPMRAHEDILVFYDKQCTFNPQMTNGHTPMHGYTKRASVQNKTAVYGKVNKDVSGGGSTIRYPRSVIVFASDKQKTKLDGTIHSTQKPIALLEYLLRAYTNKDDTVLDNVAGSGSCGVACANTGRNFIGIELFPLLDKPIDKKTNPNYFFIAEKRIGIAYARQPLL